MEPLHERLNFDTAQGAVFDADRRYVLVRADVLMATFDALPGPAREEALRAFGRAVASQGSGSVRAYLDAVGAAALPAMLEGAAASLGWGRWRLGAGDDTASDDVARADIRRDDMARDELASDPAASADLTRSGSLRLEVENSPFAAASQRRGEPACHAIAGMLEGVAAALWRSPAQARETHCAAVRGAAGPCRFVATRALPRPNLA
jgi:predicted hydrocarbon binding protein